VTVKSYVRDRYGDSEVDKAIIHAHDDAAPLEVPRQPDEGRCILELGLMASAEPEPDDRAVCVFADVLELEGGRLLLNGDHDRRP
jgi:hypothetical protein